MKIPVLFLSLILFSGRLPAQNRSSSIPFQLVEDIIFIKVNLNGSADLTFMFDTGAGITVLNTATAGDLPLVYAGQSTINTSGKKIAGQSTVHNTLTIGQATLDSLSIEVIPLDHLSDYFGIPIDGIIGYDLFNRYVVETSVDHQTLTMHEALPDKLGTGWQKEKMYCFKNGQIGLDVSMLTKTGQYIALPFTIDTGKPDQLSLFQRALEQHEITISTRNKTVKGFSADTTITTNQRIRMKRIGIANEQWRNVKTVLNTDPVSIAAFADSEAFGLIGQALLLDFNIVYDFANAACYLQRSR